jgi:hypothetical protein
VLFQLRAADRLGCGDTSLDVVRDLGVCATRVVTDGKFDSFSKGVVDDRFLAGVS